MDLSNVNPLVATMSPIKTFRVFVPLSKRISVPGGCSGATEIKEPPLLADVLGFGRPRAVQPRSANGLWPLSETPDFGLAWDEEVLSLYTCERRYLMVDQHFHVSGG